MEAVPLRYDHDAFLAWFDGLWEATAAAVSYRSRIVDGPDDRLEDSLLGGFTRGPAARVEAPPRRARATKEDVELALAKLVYFEDVMDDDACLRTVDEPSTIQVNVGARCNLACAHCHVEAGPHRTEAMDRATFEAVLAVAARPGIDTVDVTGGAPEMNPHFAWFIEQASRVARVMVRTNLVILRDPSYAPLVDRYAELGVEVVASLPNVHAAQAEQQRGNATFDPSLAVLRELNARGYGRDGAHVLDLVFNPQWPVLPPDQDELEDLYRRRLAELGVSFDHLFAVANNPIGRYGAHLVDTGEFDPVPRPAHRRFQPGGVRRHDVPRPAVRGLGRARVRLRLQPGPRPVHTSRGRRRPHDLRLRSRPDTAACARDPLPQPLLRLYGWQRLQLRRHHRAGVARRHPLCASRRARPLPLRPNCRVVTPARFASLRERRRASSRAAARPLRRLAKKTIGI